MIVELGAVVLLLGILATLGGRLRMSAVPLFLLVGLALGEGGLLPLHLSSGFLKVGAEIGAVLLLLLLGLEHSAREIKETIQRRWPAAVVDLLANAVPGIIAALLLGWGWSGALVMAGITFVSSSGIAAQLLHESGWRGSQMSKRLVSALVAEDIVMAPYLPTVSAVVAGVGLLAGILSVAIALGVTAFALAVSLRKRPLPFRVLPSHDPIALMFTVFGLALLAAGIAEAAGISGAIGAFLVGLALTGEVANTVRDLLVPLRDIFSAVFFLFFGLGALPAEVVRELPIAVVLSVVGALGKALVARHLMRDSSDPHAWKRVTAYLVPRGEFSIVIAGLAASAAFGDRLQPLVTGYVVCTALIGTLLLRATRSRLS